MEHVKEICAINNININLTEQLIFKCKKCKIKFK